MTKTIFAALALSVVAAGASANTQLAQSLNVEPGVYTTAELIQLRDARDANDVAKINFLEQRAEAVMRGVAFAGASDDAVIFAYENSLNNDDGNDENLAHFVAKVTGETSVSADAVAFAQAHFAADSDDEE